MRQNIIICVAAMFMALTVSCAKEKQQPEEKGPKMSIAGFEEIPFCTVDTTKSEVMPFGVYRENIPIVVGEEDCTVILPENDWITFNMENSTVLPAGTRTTLEYTISCNLGPNEDRSCEVVIKSNVSDKKIVLPFNQSEKNLYNDGTTYTLSARWLFNTDYQTLVQNSWLKQRYMPSYSANNSKSKLAGYLSFVRAKENEDVIPVELSYNNKIPVIKHMGPNDYWLITLPGITCEADDCFEFYFGYAGDVNCPKYYITEIWNGKEWVANEKMLLSAEEDPSIKFTVMAAGTVVDSGGEQYAYSETVCPGHALNNETMYLRIRAVGNYAASGAKLDIKKNNNNLSGFVVANYTAIYVNKLVGKRPAKSIKAFYTGNSFTYYYHSIPKLKQLAWSQGLEIQGRGFLKSGSSNKMHQESYLAPWLIRRGDYDIALIQNSSVLEPLWPTGYYSTDPNIDPMSQNTKMAKLIHQYNPKCQIYQEQTWASPRNGDDYVESKWLIERGYADNSNNRMKVLDELIEMYYVELLKREPSIIVSRVGRAFTNSRNAGMTDLFHTDDHHPNNNGGYLKACTNCVTITGKALQNAPTFDGISPEMAAKYQSFANAAAGK